MTTPEEELRRMAGRDSEERVLRRINPWDGFADRLAESGILISEAQRRLLDEMPVPPPETPTTDELVSVLDSQEQAAMIRYGIDYLLERLRSNPIFIEQWGSPRKWRIRMYDEDIYTPDRD